MNRVNTTDIPAADIRRAGVAAAHHAGCILNGLLGRLSNIRKKGAIDLVTEADLASEKAVIDVIRHVFPDHAILAEESGLTGGGKGGHQWIIDPLDGTTNFAHGLPQFCVSIAHSLDGEPDFGVVLNPATGELFLGQRGHGAFLNGRPIHVSATETVADALLVTGFPYDFQEILPEVLGRLRECLVAARAMRRFGSAALDLCYVACGRFDGFWEQRLKPWDTAAGIVIAREAGAQVTDFDGGRFTVDRPSILATNGRVHAEMITLLRVSEEIRS